VAYPLAPEQRALYPSLAGKRVLVTGGGSGIGAALVEGFVRQGSDVTFFDIDETESLALVEQLEGGAGSVRYERVDLLDIEGTQAAIAAAAADQVFDVLVNNAARDDRHRWEDVTPSYFDERIAINLRHLFFCAQSVVPGMRARGGGAIINMGSISWHLAIAEMPLYQAAKAAIEGLTRALARDLGSEGIRVTCVVPGSVRTPRQAKWYPPEEEAKIVSEQMIHHRILPEDVAALVLFLASDDARVMTAHPYWVDGGWR